MPTIEQSNQPEDQTKDEKSSPSSDESGSSATETIETKQSSKVAVKKKTVRKAARKKVAQTTGRQIQDEQSNSSATETKQTTQAGKVAVKKKTVRKKTAKKKTSQTTSGQIQDEQSNSGATETKQTTQPGKVAVKKKTVRKKAAKKKTSQTKLKQIQLEPASESDKAAASLVVNAAGKTAPATQNQPEKPVENAAPPAAAPSRPQPQPQGATGLMGFWIKVGISAFVIVAGIITVFSFFGEDETTSGPETTQATVGAQGENASVADGIAADRRTAPGVAFPPTPEQSSVLDRNSSQRYGNQPGAFTGGAAVANKPAMESAANAAVTPSVSPNAGQPPASQPYAAPPNPRGNSFYHQPSEYRAELYRPLEPEQAPSAPTQSSGGANETPRTNVVPAPSYHPQPGTYAYPPAPQQGGYGGYYPY